MDIDMDIDTITGMTHACLLAGWIEGLGELKGNV